MRVAQLTTTAEFEWIAHWDMAVKHGISVEQLEEPADGGQRPFSPTNAPCSPSPTSSPTTSTSPTRRGPPLAGRFSDGELVELVLTVSFYSCVSRVLRALADSTWSTRPTLGAAAHRRRVAGAADGSSSAPSG